MESVGEWPSGCSYPYQYPHYRRYRPSQRTRPPPFNNVLLERPQLCPNGRGTYFSPTRTPGFDMHSGDDSDLDLSDEALSQVLEEDDDGVGDGERGGVPNLAATSTEKLRQAKDLWDLRWSRWWGYNWSRKRDEAVRNQRVHMTRTDRPDRRTPETSATTVHSHNKSDSSRRYPDTVAAQAGPCSSDEVTPATSGESEDSQTARRRVWRRLEKFCNSSKVRIHALRERIADKRRVLFKKNERRKLNEENLIDFDTNTNRKAPVPLIPEYLTEAEPEKRKSVHNVEARDADRESSPDKTRNREEFKLSARSMKRLNSSSTSLASLEHLAVRLQQLQKMDDVAEVPLSDAPERSAINVSRGTSPISIFSAKQSREPTARVQQAYRLMVEKQTGVPPPQSSPVDTIKTFAKSDYHFDPATVRHPQRTMVYNNQHRDPFMSKPFTKEPPQHHAKSTPVAPTRASAHSIGRKNDDVAYMLEQHRLFSQATSEASGPEQHHLFRHHKQATNKVLPEQQRIFSHRKQTTSEVLSEENHLFPQNKQAGSQVLPEQNYLFLHKNQATSNVQPEQNHPITNNNQPTSDILPEQHRDLPKNNNQATDNVPPEHRYPFSNNHQATSEVTSETHRAFPRNNQATDSVPPEHVHSDDEDPSDGPLNLKEDGLTRDFDDFFTSLQRKRESSKFERPFIPNCQPLRNYSLYKPRVLPSYTGAPLLSPLLRGRVFPPHSILGSTASPLSFPHYPSMYYSLPLLAPWLTTPNANTLYNDGYAFPHQKFKAETADKQFRSISSQTDEDTFVLINRRSQKSMTAVEVEKTKSIRTMSTQTEESSLLPVALEEAVTCCHQTTSTHFTEACGTQTNMNEYSSKPSRSFKPPKMIYEWLGGTEHASVPRSDVSPESCVHSPYSDSLRSSPVIRGAHLPAVPEKREFDFVSSRRDRSLSLSHMADYPNASMVVMKSSRGVKPNGYQDDLMTSDGAPTIEEHLLFIDYESLPEIKSSEDLASSGEQCELPQKVEQVTQTTNKRSRKQKIKLFFQRKLSNLSSASE